MPFTGARRRGAASVGTRLAKGPENEGALGSRVCGEFGADHSPASKPPGQLIDQFGQGSLLGLTLGLEQVTLGGPDGSRHGHAGLNAIKPALAQVRAFKAPQQQIRQRTGLARGPREIQRQAHGQAIRGVQLHLQGRGPGLQRGQALFQGDGQPAQGKD